MDTDRSVRRTCRSDRAPAARGLLETGRVLGIVLAAFVVVSASAVVSPSMGGLDAAVQTGAIEGRVALQQVERPGARRPGVANLGAPPPRDLSDRRVSVVYLETAPRGAFEQIPPGRAVMDQRNEAFAPHVLAITTGTVVDFKNSDQIYHNVFSLSKPGSFDLGRYQAGRSKPVRFDRPGIVRVFCDIHSHMSAFILVFSHPFFAVTDVDGRFHIDGVPPGTYNVIAWYEGAASGPRPVTVPGNGVGDVEFVFR